MIKQTEKWYYRVLPIFSLIMAIFWGNATWKNYRSGDTGETIITLVIFLLFAIGCIGSLVLYRFKCIQKTKEQACE